LTVIDCSAMVELLAARSATGDAIANRLARTHSVHAPYVLDAEIVSSLLGLIRGQKITEQEADDAIRNYRAFPIDQHDVLPLWSRIKILYANLSGYSAQYVALAEALDMPLITTDARIKRSRAAHCSVEVFGADA
jgi:predicted nucleic acid-binding protein